MFDFIYKFGGGDFRRKFAMVTLVIIGLSMILQWDNLLNLSYIKYPFFSWIRIFGAFLIFIFILIKKRGIS